MGSAASRAGRAAEVRSVKERVALHLSLGAQIQMHAHFHAEAWDSCVHFGRLQPLIFASVSSRLSASTAPDSVRDCPPLRPISAICWRSRETVWPPLRPILAMCSRFWETLRPPLLPAAAWP